MKIGLISDTHGWIHPRLPVLFAGCDEIWHAGDIGGIKIADNLLEIKPLRAVYGNIDDALVRRSYPENQRFTIDEISVWITHIGGHPGNYDRRVITELKVNPPDLFICGHSHIARAMFDKSHNFLYLNPGAAGNNGFHKIMTAMRFQIDGKQIHDLEVIELGERGRPILRGH